MKQLVIGIIVGTILTFLSLTGWFLYQNNSIPIVQAPEMNSEQEDEVEQEPTIIQEQNEKQDDQSVTIPPGLYEQLDVTDLEVQDLSIANQPDLWRTFLNSPAPMSDPLFEFGCLEYQDTGAQIVVNLFVDEANIAWVSESVGNELIGVGKLSFIDYDRVTAYRTVDQEIACLELLKRQYDKYYLLSEQREFRSMPNYSENVRMGFSMIFLVNNVYLPLPYDVMEFQSSDTGAGREPVFVANRYLLGYGGGGIYVFDVETWEMNSLFGLNWDELRGVTRIITYDDESPVIAFAYQEWQEMPQALVVVYDLASNDGNPDQYIRNASLKWTMGSNEIFALEEPGDLVFNSPDEIWITEYPEFDEQVSSGEYPPNPGKKEITEWMYAK